MRRHFQNIKFRVFMKVGIVRREFPEACGQAHCSSGGISRGGTPAVIADRERWAPGLWLVGPGLRPHEVLAGGWRGGGSVLPDEPQDPEAASRN